MSHLTERMHPCVGASGSIELEVGPAGDIAHGSIDLALHRSRVLLNLPAAVAGPRVLDGQLEPGHGSELTTSGSQLTTGVDEPLTTDHYASVDLTARSRVSAESG